ncbi:hypothetical protein RSAG8_01260, partial [Rhizoctonia solani AG-8 WAC10335]
MKMFYLMHLPYFLYISGASKLPTHLGVRAMFLIYLFSDILPCILNATMRCCKWFVCCACSNQVSKNQKGHCEPSMRFANIRTRFVIFACVLGASRPNSTWRLL